MADESLTSDSHGQKTMRKRFPEYRVWEGIKERCSNTSNAPSRKYYQDKGVKMCERWRRSFDSFYIDMGPRPTDKHSIDRIDSDGDYEPSNCRWATLSEQNRNRSCAHFITIDGETKNLAEWAEIAGLTGSGINARIKQGLTGADLIKPSTKVWKDHNKKFTHNGLSLTWVEWSKHLGVPSKRLRTRYYDWNWTLAETLDTPKGVRLPRQSDNLITAFGKTLNCDQWARESGIAASTIRMRMKKGWTSERALSEPLQNHGRSTVRDKIDTPHVETFPTMIRERENAVTA